MAVALSEEQLNLFPAVEQIQFHHENTKGFVVILKKNKKGVVSQISMPSIQLPGRIYDICRSDADYWMSQNGFYKHGTRKIKDIGQLVALFVDLDCYKLKISAEKAIQTVYEDYINNNKIPCPSMIIKSGQGVQLIWRIQPETAYALPTWQGVEDWFLETLKPLGADPQVKDAARVLRVAGTFNKKNNALAEIQYDATEIYSLTDICKNYILPNLPTEEPTQLPIKSTPKKTTKLQENNKIKRLFSTYSLYYARMNDVSKLIELRCNAHEDRKRELLLFLYRYYSCMYCYDPAAALDEMLYLNKMFRNPLSETEIATATHSAEVAYENRDNEEFHAKAKAKGYAKYGYNYKTITLIKLLEITDAEQQHMTNLIGPVEKQRRKEVRRHEVGRCDRRDGQAPSVDRETYLLECEQSNAEKILKAKELKEQGMTHQKIAEVLGITKMSVSRYMKK